MGYPSCDFVRGKLRCPIMLSGTEASQSFRCSKRQDSSPDGLRMIAVGVMLNEVTDLVRFKTSNDSHP